MVFETSGEQSTIVQDYACTCACACACTCACACACACAYVNQWLILSNSTMDKFSLP